MWLLHLSRCVDNNIGSEPAGRQRVFNRAIMDQLMAAINECKQPGVFLLPYVHRMLTYCMKDIYIVPYITGKLNLPHLA